MKRPVLIVCIFLTGMVVGLLANLANAQFRSVKRTTLLTTDLAGWCEGKQVTVELNEFAPGTSGKHYHHGHSFTWILEGSEEYALEGKPVRIVKAGEVLHEEPMRVHTVQNQSPVKLLVFRVEEQGKPAIVRVP